MKITVSSLTATVFAVPGEDEHPGARVYRLRKRFAAVQFDAQAKGSIVLLPEGAKLRIVGCSCLSECVEVEYHSQRFNIFKVDLFGTGAMVQNSPIRAAHSVAMGACA